MNNEHKKPPTTVSEIGIHIGYINEKLDSIVERLSNSPSRAEFEVVKADIVELKGLVEKNDNKYVTRKEFAVVGTVLGVVVTVVNFGINIFNNLRG